MKWHDAIPALGIQKLTPEPRCLIQCTFDSPGEFVKGEWLLGSHEQDFLGILDCIPILPSVPEGKTCAQGFDTICTGKPDDGPGRILSLENGYISWHDVGIVYWPYNGAQGTDYVTATNYPTRMRDMQKYGALLRWIEFNLRTKMEETK